MKRGRWRCPAVRRTSGSTARRAKRSARPASRGDSRPAHRGRPHRKTKWDRSDIIFKMEFAAAESGAIAAAGRPLRGSGCWPSSRCRPCPTPPSSGAPGADVVKIEPLAGELGRASLPAMSDPGGRAVGATFLRNNLNKRTMCVDLKQPDGRQLVLDLAPRFDIFAEISKRARWIHGTRLRRHRGRPSVVRVGVGLRQFRAEPLP